MHICVRVLDPGVKTVVSGHVSAGSIRALDRSAISSPSFSSKYYCTFFSVCIYEHTHAHVGIKGQLSGYPSTV